MRIVLILLLSLAVLTSLPAQEGPAQDVPENESDLLATALFSETNTRRLREGMVMLRPLPALFRAALDHATDMAQKHYLSHTGKSPGRETFVQRLAAVGIRFGYRGENLAQGFALDYEEGRPFLPPAVTGAGFRYHIDDADMEWMSAEEAARALLDQWMGSDLHRANVLNPEYRFLGVAGVVADEAEFGDMPMVKAVQLFSSSPGSETD